jgi:aldose 1-epimerase
VAAPPSGEQFTISGGGYEATAVEVGGGLRTLTLAGRPPLDGYGEAEMCDGGRGQHLVPWPNRIQDGRYEFGGREHELALTEPARGNAIHGLLRWVAWRRVEQRADRLRLAQRVHPQPGYPFRLDVEVEYRLGEGGLEVRTRAVNSGDAACPYGAGAHPYLTAGGEAVDGCRLRLPAASRLAADERGIPTGAEPVAGTEYDFREGREIGAIRLDTAYADLEPDEAGNVRVELSGPAGVVTLWMDASHRYVMLFTGDTLRPERRRRGVAVEPMTCTPNAFRSGEGLVVLQPGEAAESAWGISGRPA